VLSTIQTWLKGAVFEVQAYVLLVISALRSIVKQIDDVMSSVYERDYMTPPVLPGDGTMIFATQADLDAHVRRLQEQMKAAATNLDFEKAATIRDDIKRLRDADLGVPWPARRA